MYDPKRQGITIGGSDYESTPKTYKITVEDCEVWGQREWSGNAKASFLAGGGADNITFKNCTAYRVGFYDSTPDSPADLFDTDDATNVEYRNCTAVGTDNENIRKGADFWNEGEQEASSEYWDCTAIKTGGGLAAAQESTAIAHNFYFDECSWGGWAAWSHGGNANLEIYNYTFDNCYSTGDPPYLEGGVHFDDGDGVVKDCTFINTPDGYNVSFYTPTQGSNITVLLENNTFDRGAKSHGISDGSGNIYIINNDLGPNASFDKDGDYYNWHSDKSETTTTAINSPTSSTTVSVEYQSHFTGVQYNSGESFDWMLVKMRDAINADSGAYVTADINMNKDKITFTKKDASYSDNQVSIYIESSDWGNGDPFYPMNPMFP